jgi:hypothetical protein
MAAVFLMQSASNLIASALMMILLVTLGRNSGLATDVDQKHAALVVDKMWRIVVGAWWCSSCHHSLLPNGDA